MYCVVDIETTGGNQNYSKITEIAIYRYDGKDIVDELVTLVNPEQNIPDFITRLTGITNSMVEDAPKFYEIAKRIIEITEGATFVAHNVGFDYGIIQCEFSNLGFEYHRNTLCTVKLARAFLPGHKSYSLGKICDDLDINIEGRHRAGGDALATVKLFELIIEKNGLDFTESPIEKKLNIKSLNPLLSIAKLKSLPQNVGVYYLKNEKSDIVYIGKSKNIKSRVLNHLKGEGSRKADSMRYEVVDVDYVETGNELIAMLKESDEIKEIQPKYNRALKRKHNQFGLYTYNDRNGYCRFLIKKNSINDIPIYSYPNIDQAQQHLYKLVDEYELCQKMCGLYDGDKGCFQDQLKQCHGACVGEEQTELYNQRASQLIQSLEFGYKNIVIIDKGRSANEYSAVYVENGSYKGYGYFDGEQSFMNPQSFLEIISLRDNTRDSRLIISSFLKKNKPLKLINF
jgi:DNA polymerase III subunit epsilon